MSRCPFCALTPDSVATMTDDEARQVYSGTCASKWCDGHATSAFNVGSATHYVGRKLVLAIVRHAESFILKGTAA